MRRLVGRIVGTVPNVRWLVLGIATVAIVCAFLARFLAHEDFPTLGIAMWWSVQTVTTVGYGDITPKTLVGRSIASVLMVSAVALISVITASISAGFVNRLQARRGHSMNAEILDTLARIEQRLDAIDGGAPAASDAAAPESSPG